MHDPHYQGLLDYPVTYDPYTGDVEPAPLENPVPERAVEQRHAMSSVDKAMDLCGLGRIAWADVERYVADWEAREIGRAHV